MWTAIRSIECPIFRPLPVIARSEATKQSTDSYIQPLDCFAALAMTVWLTARKPLTTAPASPSIRLHIVFGNDRVCIESLVDETLFLQPCDLVADILDVELAVGIDVGAVADHLLDRQVGVFRDDLQQRLCCVVDRRLAAGDGGQNDIVIFTVGAGQRAEKLRPPRLFWQRV